VKSTCYCGAPRRPGGNACRRCHAEDSQRYRARKKDRAVVASRWAQLAERFAGGFIDWGRA
jgi:hypothetical protein